jgi:hypothetical protein
MNGQHGQETITRNWNEMLQELRVLQTGVQILTGFLLTVPFTSRFPDLGQRQVTTYLVVLCGATLTTGLVVAPVAFHRVLFRRRLRPWLVAAADRSAKLGLATFALTSSGVLLLVFDVVLGLTPALVAFAVGLTVFVVLWIVLPLVGGQRGTRTTPPDG